MQEENNIDKIIIETLKNKKMYKSFSTDNIIELMKIDRIEKLIEKLDRFETLTRLKIDKMLRM